MLNHINDTYPVFNTHIHNDTNSDSEGIFFDAVEDLDCINSSLSKRKRDREDDTANSGPTKRNKMVLENNEIRINRISVHGSPYNAMIRANARGK